MTVAELREKLDAHSWGHPVYVEVQTDEGEWVTLQIKDVKETELFGPRVVLETY